ncbi:P-loop containing nucleoside triphosphate hydrolase protein [Boletus coccyginus]|nr:P-loop containing nucleoside triphosphate hydrolase protein [Boletus coccyginus]
MLPKTQGLHVHNRELEEVEMSPEVQHRVTSMSEDAIEQNNVAALPSRMEEDEDEVEPSPQTNTVVRLGKGDVGRVRDPTKMTEPFHAHADDDLVPQHNRSTAPGIDGGGSPRSGFMRPSQVVEPGRVDLADVAHIPNIIIFGEAGVGKSSVINLIAGQKRAHISNDALGCTFQYQRHTVMLDEMPFALWDTTGLDEGSEGIVPAKLAEGNLRALIRGLANSGGIHLVIYCIRGTRLTKALKHNYDLFYTAVCRKKVPVALVVTGLEYQEGDMETWWDENKAALQCCGMWFHAHACVTTLDVDDAVIRARRSDSQKRLRELVVEYAGRRPWKIEPSISLTLFRNILRGLPSMGKKTTRRVIVCDGTTSRRTHTRLIGDQQLEYELVYVNKLHTPSTSCKWAGVLVFYTSTLLGTRIPTDDVAALRKFYDGAGGRMCPVIVVLRGCKDDRLAQRCWDAVSSRYLDIQARPVVDEQAKLDAMIEELCIEHVDVKSSRLHRAYEAVVEFFAAMAHLW